MLDKIKQFLLDEDKVNNVIWCVGYVVIGWVLDILAWLASKTKTKTDDAVVATAKETLKQAKKKKKSK